MSMKTNRSAASSSNMSTTIVTILCLLGMICVLLLASCGGGTGGTGGDGSTRISGKLLNQDRQPVAAGNIAISETGDSSVSDSEGNFALNAEVPGNTVTFFVEKDSTEASATLSDVPDRPLAIDVTLQLDQPRRALSIAEPKIAPRPPPTPSGAITPAPTATSNSPSLSIGRTEVAVLIHATTGTLDRATLMLAEKRSERGYFIAWGTDASTNTTTYRSSVRLLRDHASTLLVQTKNGPTFTIEVSPVDSNAAQLTIYARLLPLSSPGAGIPNGAGLASGFQASHIFPDRYSVPTVRMSPQPDTSLLPTPTPTIDPTYFPTPSSLSASFTVRYANGNRLLGSRLVFADPNIGTVPLIQNTTYSNTFEARFPMPRTTNTQQFTLETPSRSYSGTLEGLSSLAGGYMSLQFSLLPRRQSDDPSTAAPRWIEIDHIYPEGAARGDLRLSALEPTPPPSYHD